MSGSAAQGLSAAAAGAMMPPAAQPAPGSTPLPTVPVGMQFSGADDTFMDEDAAPAGGAAAPVPATAGLDFFGTSKALYRGFTTGMERLGAAGGDVLGAESGGLPFQPYQPQNEPGAGEPMVTAQEANGAGKDLGLHFDAPVPQDILHSMLDEAQNAQKRAVLRQHMTETGGIVHGGLQFAADLLDPVNIAASFIPIGGEGILGGALARAGIEGATESVIGRGAVRAVAGAATGAIGQIPVAGALAAAQVAEGQPADPTAFLTQMLHGAEFGGVLHPLAGAIGDAVGAFRASRIGRQVVADPPLAQPAATAAIAAVAEDRPVGVAPLIELGAREREQALALRSLQYDSNQPIALRLNALEDDLTAPGTPEALRGNLAQQYEAAQGIAASQADMAAASGPTDEATAGRLAAVENELTVPGPLTAARQTALLAEHRMLTEGAAPVSEAQADLEAARTEAQRRGNAIAIARNDARIAALQNEIGTSAAAGQALGDPAPDAAAASAAAQRLAEAAPPVPGPGAPPAVPSDMPEIEAMVAGMRGRGEMLPEDEAVVTAQDAEDKEAGTLATIMRTLGTCMGSAV